MEKDLAEDLRAEGYTVARWYLGLMNHQTMRRRGFRLLDV